jgi:hypothetical protein
VYLIGGVALSSWAAFESRGAPFLAGSKFTPTGRDGSYPLLLIIIGIVVAGYGFFELVNREEPKEPRLPSDHDL